MTHEVFESFLTATREKLGNLPDRRVARRRLEILDGIASDPSFNDVDYTRVDRTRADMLRTMIETHTRAVHHHLEYATTAPDRNGDNGFLFVELVGAIKADKFFKLLDEPANHWIFGDLQSCRLIV